MEFEKAGHSVDVERIFPAREHGSWSWFFIRIFKGECNIQDSKIKDASKYDVVCFGGPNWTRLSLPVARYIREINGLEHKKIGFFATTILWPFFEWYILSAYLLDLTFSRAIEKKEGKIVSSLTLSSFFKSWVVSSDRGEKKIKTFCKELEAPSQSSKEYFLEQKEIGGARFLTIIISSLLLVSLFLQFFSSVIGSQVITWNEYLFLFVIGAFAYIAVLTMLAGRIGIFFVKYVIGVALIAELTMFSLFLMPTVGGPIVLGYILIFIIISLFRDLKAVLFTGLVAALGYVFLYFVYPQREILEIGLDFKPDLDLGLLLIIIVAISLVTRTLQKHHLNLLDAQDETEMSRAVLEVKVGARTKELKEFSEGLEEQVATRTKELQGKMEALEKFNRLAVGRELKMIELKRDIADLKNEQKTKSKKLKKEKKKSVKEFGEEAMEIEKKPKALERFQSLAVERELKMITLKKELKKLKDSYDK